MHVIAGYISSWKEGQWRGNFGVDETDLGHGPEPSVAGTLTDWAVMALGSSGLTHSAVCQPRALETAASTDGPLADPVLGQSEKTCSLSIEPLPQLLSILFCDSSLGQEIQLTEDSLRTAVPSFFRLLDLSNLEHGNIHLSLPLDRAARF